MSYIQPLNQGMNEDTKQVHEVT